MAGKIPSSLPSLLTPLFSTAANEQLGSLSGSLATSLMPLDKETRVVYPQPLQHPQNITPERGRRIAQSPANTAGARGQVLELENAAADPGAWGGSWGASSSAFSSWTQRQAMVGLTATPSVGLSGYFSIWAQSPLVTTGGMEVDRASPLLLQLLTAVPKLSSSEDNEQASISHPDASPRPPISFCEKATDFSNIRPSHVSLGVFPRRLKV